MYNLPMYLPNRSFMGVKPPAVLLFMGIARMLHIKMPKKANLGFEGTFHVTLIPPSIGGGVSAHGSYENNAKVVHID